MKTTIRICPSARLRTLLVKLGLLLVVTGGGPALAEQLDCVIEPSEVADVSSSVSGIMSEVLVKRGDWVEKGETLARLESSVEQASFELARAEAEAQNQIQARRARLSLAKKRLQRALELSKTSAISSQEVDEAKTDVELAAAELSEAQHNRRLAQLRLARAQSLLDLRTIKSPVAGVVTKIHTSAGESVEDRPIMSIVQIDPLYVEAIVPVSLFGRIHEGDVFHVYPEEPVSGDFVARVSLVERVIDAPSGTFGVRLNLPNSDRLLPAGLRCKLSFTDSVAADQ
ncbi:MAG: efflux RND transporter periplasmic adaptor subunit [Oceanospirillaceae bacterium]|nr:efflux RND transporter periplasmic adaptor subunit [Oceanospirillaceae bacterium]